MSVTVKSGRHYEVSFQYEEVKKILTSNQDLESDVIDFFGSKWKVVFKLEDDQHIFALLNCTSVKSISVDYNLILQQSLPSINRILGSSRNTTVDTSGLTPAFPYGSSYVGEIDEMNIVDYLFDNEFRLTLSLVHSNSFQTQEDTTGLYATIRDNLFHQATSDVDIVVEGIRIPAHKVILSVSPVFTAMFESQMQESVSNEIVISDFSEEVVRSMLRCIYSSEDMYNEIGKHAEQLLFIANKYELTSIENAAINHIIANITVDNAVDVLLSADKFDRVKIKTAVMNFIVNNATVFFEDPNFGTSVGFELTCELLKLVSKKLTHK